MQTKSEAPDEFEQRVQERLSHAARDGQGFITAVLLTGSRQDEATVTARERIALALARHCAESDGAELLLEGALENELGVSTPLLSLADTVRAAVGDRPISVQLSLRESATPRVASDSAFWHVGARRHRAS